MLAWFALPIVFVVTVYLARLPRRWITTDAQASFGRLRRTMTGRMPRDRSPQPMHRT
jgi:hypothetical protein